MIPLVIAIGLNEYKENFMKIEQLVVGDLGVNCYIVSCERTKEAAVIDPGANAKAILDKIGDLKVIAIINTHGHADHISANKKIKDATHADILIHRDDAQMLLESRLNLSVFLGESIESYPADRILNSGDTVNIGDIILKVIHTPGHTKGGICLYTDGILFSGDTLFAESIGRTDFPGGSMQGLIHSVTEKLLNLPDDTRVLPGHGPSTTIGWERMHNQFLS